MSQAATTPKTPNAVLARSVPRQISWAWLGVAPFFIFAAAFLLWPSATILTGSFQDNEGQFTLANVFSTKTGLFQPFILNAYWLSIRISLVTALAGGIFGFLLAYAAILGGLPKSIRTGLMTFSGVASNFAGVPLAFAFIATLGRTGFITSWFKWLFGISIYDQGFNLYSFAGLSLTYMYFQLPLMVLILAPALDGLKREWREASENLGATSWQYWRYIALPILLPSLIGMMILLFGNAFSAYATAFALTGGSLNLVPIVIGAQIRGDVLHNPGLGNALALGMVVVMMMAMLVRLWLQRRSERWLR